MIAPVTPYRPAPATPRPSVSSACAAGIAVAASYRSVAYEMKLTYRQASANGTPPATIVASQSGSPAKAEGTARRTAIPIAAPTDPTHAATRMEDVKADRAAHRFELT